MLSRQLDDIGTNIWNKVITSNGNNNKKKKNNKTKLVTKCAVP